MLEGILPPGVVVSASGIDLPEARLFPEEQAAVENAVEKRRLEFTTGRACAHDALAKLGVPPQAIPPGEGGAPEWPTGVIGSITHCDGYRACAAARTESFATIGVDAEPNRPLPAGLLPDVALPRERAWVAALGSQASEVAWDRLLFCTKEAVYKAWFPLARRWLGFEDAAIEVDREARTFSARLLVPGPRLGDGEVTGFEGRWAVRDGLVLAAIAVQSPRGVMRKIETTSA